MYTYLYDNFLTETKYAKTLAAIETRFTDLGIQGRVDRISTFKNPKEILHDAVRRDMKTIVIVGNDDTVRKVLEVIPDFNFTFGIIPVGAPNKIAKFLGIPEGEAACDVLSARIIEKMDIGKINNKFFFGNISIPQTTLPIICNDNFTIHPENVASVYVHNLPIAADSSIEPNVSRPCDGNLDLYVATPPSSVFGKVRWWLGNQKNLSKERISVLPVKKIRIKSDILFSIFADGAKIETSEANIEVVPQKLKMITGKERMF